MTVEKSYDCWSETYDSMDNKTRDLEKIAGMKTLSSENFRNVVELGCGTGKNTEWLLERSKKIIALDFSSRMLAIAREKINSDKVVFKQANILKTWDVEDEWADLVTCSLVLEHIDDIRGVFDEARQKLRAGGKFFICELHPFKQYQGSRAKFESDAGPKSVDVFLHHVSDFTCAAREAGFTIVELNEWFDNDERDCTPRLISLLLQK